MDFQQLLAKMAQLDQPVGETVVPECGEPMGMTPPMGGNMGKPDTPPPSMSVNLNAQGMDNIEELLKLVTKVNPEMDKPEMPSAPHIEIEPIGKPEMPKLGGLGDLDKGPLKMLPDLDADNDDKVGGEKDMGPEPIDNDEEGPGEPKGDDEKEAEAFANSLVGSKPEEYDIDASIPSGNDIHKPKQQFRAAQPGDNPMAMEATELRSWIKAELQQRLAEVKGAK